MLLTGWVGGAACVGSDEAGDWASARQRRPRLSGAETHDRLPTSVVVSTLNRPFAQDWEKGDGG